MRSTPEAVTRGRGLGRVLAARGWPSRFAGRCSRAARGSRLLGAYRAAGKHLWSHGIAADPSANLGLVPGLYGEYLVATRGGPMVLVTRIHAVMGTVEARVLPAR